MLRDAVELPFNCSLFCMKMQFAMLYDCELGL